MSKKGFVVKVELEIQKVTCPGVWLCTNGKVSLQLYLLNSRAQSKACRPSFPILCYEKFEFYRTFYDVRRLNELQRCLNNEWFYVELVQWRNCEEGCVLATFQTTLDDLLYPTAFRGSLAGADVDLLMEPTVLFPGTISPKLEIATKTTVEQTYGEDEKKSPVVNPKLLVISQNQAPRGRPRRVCHSMAFQRGQKCYTNKSKKTRPIFQYKKPEDDLIIRTNPNVVLKPEESPKRSSRGEDLIRFRQEGENIERAPCGCYCKCNSYRARSHENLRSYVNMIRSRRSSPENYCTKPSEACFSRKLKQKNKPESYFCPVCAKYDTYFSSTSEVIKRSPVNIANYCSHCRKYANAGTKFHIRSASGSPCRSDITEDTTNKVCFSLSKARLRNLSEQLHDRLRQTIQTNSRLVQNCIDCDD